MRSFTTAAAIFRPTASLATAVLSLGLLVGGCGSGSEDEGEIEVTTRSDFCERWAVAACSSEVVSVCQASSADDCQIAQETACLDALPGTFVDRGVDDCIAAVRKAYEDADLTAAELDTVLRFSGHCSDVILANESGEICEIDSNCEPALSCVLKGETEGSCEEDVVIVEAGHSCTEPEEKCEAGFYCDGRNCLAALREGADCSNDSQCDTEMYCNEICLAKLDVNEECESDAECVSGICYETAGERSCLNRLRLSPAEPL
jgi:hypothetical protein